MTVSESTFYSDCQSATRARHGARPRSLHTTACTRAHDHRTDHMHTSVTLVLSSDALHARPQTDTARCGSLELSGRLWLWTGLRSSSRPLPLSPPHATRVSSVSRAASSVRTRLACLVLSLQRFRCSARRWGRLVAHDLASVAACVRRCSYVENKDCSDFGQPALWRLPSARDHASDCVKAQPAKPLG